MSRCESLAAMPPSTAAEALATLTERQLGLPMGTINPVAYRLFLVAYWDRVRMYAHAVHDNQEPTWK